MNAQTQLHEDIRQGLAAHARLSLKERLLRLRDIGILTDELVLSERYGGEPAATPKSVAKGKTRPRSSK
jgi:hypothetical protein